MLRRNYCVIPKITSYLCPNWSGTKIPCGIHSQDEVWQPYLYFNGNLHFISCFQQWNIIGASAHGLFMETHILILICSSINYNVGKAIKTPTEVTEDHDDVIKWKHFPRYWPFAQVIHRSPVNSPHKGQWRRALMFSLICALNKRLSKHSWGWWFETQLRPLWRHCNICFTIVACSGSVRSIIVTPHKHVL